MRPFPTKLLRYLITTLPLPPDQSVPTSTTTATTVVRTITTLWTTTTTTLIIYVEPPLTIWLNTVHQHLPGIHQDHYILDFLMVHHLWLIHHYLKRVRGVAAGPATTTSFGEIKPPLEPLFPRMYHQD